MILNRFRELLGQLEQHLRDQRAPVSEVLRPGLSDAGMERFADRLGVRLPDEVREWYRWHDGAEKVPSSRPPYSGSGIGGYRPLPLLEAIAASEAARQSAERVAIAEVPADMIWARSWLPIMEADNRTVVVDCAVACGEPTPVRQIDPFDVPPPPVRSPSLTGAVDAWVWLLDNALLRYDADLGRWDLGGNAVPEDVLWRAAI